MRVSYLHKCCIMVAATPKIPVWQRYTITGVKTTTTNTTLKNTSSKQVL